jgi:hypothetical protein
MDAGRLLQLAKERREAEERKPLEQRRREYRDEHEARWLESEEGKLCQEFYRAYTAYKDYLQEHCREWRRGNETGLEFTEHQIHEEMGRKVGEYKAGREETDRANLEKAKQAARCTHRRLNGSYCGSPRMKDSQYCYAHDRFMAVRTQDLELPPLEDANAIVLSLTKGLQAMMKGLQAMMKGLQAMMKGQMDLKSAGMYFYGLQIVASVMGRVNFGQDEEANLPRRHGGTEKSKNL